jgi:predicted alpha/beta superfamily hydrolase
MIKMIKNGRYFGLVTIQLLLFICCGVSALAQQTGLPVIEDTVYSAALHEKRALKIVLPEGYRDTAGGRYDVVYTADGEWNTSILSGIRQFLQIDFMPPVIIVGIPNAYAGATSHRTRDLTPTSLAGPGMDGGADNFLLFLQNELIPYIEKKYPVSNNRIFCGGSLAGLFGMYTFIKKPQLFDAYLLADPSFWWDNAYLKKLVINDNGTLRRLHKTLFITARPGTAVEQGITSMDSVLRLIGSEDGLRYKLEICDGETHNSMVFPTFYYGLKFTYEGYSNARITLRPESGIAVPGQPFVVRYSGELLKNVHYTTDGSEPGLKSPLADSGLIRLKGPGVLKVKAFCNIEKYSQSAAARFEKGNASSALPLLKKAMPGGLHYSYYRGTFDHFPDFTMLTAVQSGQADQVFKINKLPAATDFALLLEGYVRVTENGYYTFRLGSGGKSRLYLGGRLLLADDHSLSQGALQSFMVPLEKGFYSLRIEYLQKDGEALLGYPYITPGSKSSMAIPKELLYTGK